MTVLCLSGWQQPADALKDILPDAQHFDYGAYGSVDEAFAALPRDIGVVVGWSLGGQLLVRAIAAGHLKAQRLVLLATPFQWLADAGFEQGLPEAPAREARASYARDPRGMVKNLNALIALGDVNGKQVARELNAHLKIWPKGMIWLDELAHASCATLDFSAFPPTLIVHGMGDKVIRFSNAQAFASRLPEVEMLLWPQCAHAPHLHDAEALQEIMADYV